MHGTQAKRSGCLCSLCASDYMRWPELVPAVWFSGACACLLGFACLSVGIALEHVFHHLWCWGAHAGHGASLLAQCACITMLSVGSQVPRAVDGALQHVLATSAAAALCYGESPKVYCDQHSAHEKPDYSKSLSSSSGPRRTVAPLLRTVNRTCIQAWGRRQARPAYATGAAVHRHPWAAGSLLCCV